MVVNPFDDRVELRLDPRCVQAFRRCRQLADRVAELPPSVYKKHAAFFDRVSSGSRSIAARIAETNRASVKTLKALNGWESGLDQRLSSYKDELNG